MINVVPFWVWWILGFIVGYGLAIIICSSRKDGVIHVTQTNDSDRYLFEFNVAPEQIPKMKQVVFGVVLEKGQPQDLQSP